MNTIERVDPKSVAADETTGRETLQLHLERYRFASRFANHGSVLDIACGVEYGNHVLAETTSAGAQIVAVDLAEDALAIARNGYAAPNITHLKHDCMTFAWREQFDAIVSMETSEHLDEPEHFLQNLIGMLKPEGVHFFSVPIKPSVDVSPYHKHDFTRACVRDMLRHTGLVAVQELNQIQSYSPLRMMQAREKRLVDTRKNLLGYYLQAPDKARLRLKSTVVDRFCNKYLTVAARTS